MHSYSTTDGWLWFSTTPWLHFNERDGRAIVTFDGVSACMPSPAAAIFEGMLLRNTIRATERFHNYHYRAPSLERTTQRVRELKLWKLSPICGR